MSIFDPRLKYKYIYDIRFVEYEDNMKIMEQFISNLAILNTPYLIKQIIENKDIEDDTYNDVCLCLADHLKIEARKKFEFYVDVIRLNPNRIRWDVHIVDEKADEIFMEYIGTKKDNK